MANFERSKTVHAFMKIHARFRQYSFQLMKCRDDSCSYCTMINPPRLPHDVFEQLSFLPDPVLGCNGRFKPFTECYGTETSDSDRPSLHNKPERTERDKKFKSMFVAAKVRNYVVCHDSGKRRVVYSAAKLTREQENAVSRVKEELLFSCGNPLFPGGNFQDIIIVKEGTNCQSPMETTYYSGTAQLFEGVCFHCGKDNDLAENTEINNLKKSNFLVRPICNACVASGKEPVTRASKKQKK